MISRFYITGGIEKSRSGIAYRLFEISAYESEQNFYAATVMGEEKKKLQAVSLSLPWAQLHSGT